MRKINGLCTYMNFRLSAPAILLIYSTCKLRISISYHHLIQLVDLPPGLRMSDRKLGSRDSLSRIWTNTLKGSIKECASRLLNKTDEIWLERLMNSEIIFFNVAWNGYISSLCLTSESEIKLNFSMWMGKFPY